MKLHRIPKPTSAVAEKRRCTHVCSKLKRGCVVIAGRRNSTVHVCLMRPARAYPLRRCALSRVPSLVIVSAYRYIAITTLAIIAVFLEYLRQFLIDLHQTYRHIVECQKTRLRAFFQLLSSSGFRAAALFLSRCAYHGVANPSTASH